MLSFEAPLFAVGCGKRFRVYVDASYKDFSDKIAVKFPVNIWTGLGTNPGTWYFNRDGESVCGRSPSGYEAKFVVEN